MSPIHQSSRASRVMNNYSNYIRRLSLPCKSFCHQCTCARKHYNFRLDWNISLHLPLCRIHNTINRSLVPKLRKFDVPWIITVLVIPWNWKKTSIYHSKLITFLNEPIIQSQQKLLTTYNQTRSIRTEAFSKTISEIISQKTKHKILPTYTSIKKFNTIYLIPTPKRQTPKSSLLRKHLSKGETFNKKNCRTKSLGVVALEDKWKNLWSITERTSIHI